MAEKAKWSQLKKDGNSYLAVFKAGSRKYQVTLQKDGHFIKAQSDIKYVDLPEIVKSTMIIQNGGDVDFHFYEAKEIFLEPNVPQYEVTMRIDGHKSKLRITMQGGFTFL